MENCIDKIDAMILEIKPWVADILAENTKIRFEIAISEVLSNLVLHAHNCTQDGGIDIRLDIALDKVKIDIFDPEGASPFDLRTHVKKLSQVNPMAESGRGLGLIMECADDLNYGISAGRNRLRLYFTSKIQT